jgi:hypothetical protein
MEHKRVKRQKNYIVITMHYNSKSIIKTDTV